MAFKSIQQLFETELGKQLSFLYTTEDDKVFVSLVEAVKHCKASELDHQEILQWKNSGGMVFLNSKLGEVIAYIEQEVAQVNWQTAIFYSARNHGEAITEEAIKIIQGACDLASDTQPMPDHCFNVMNKAIVHLLDNRPEGETAISGQWDMMKTLYFIREQFNTTP